MPDRSTEHWAGPQFCGPGCTAGVQGLRDSRPATWSKIGLRSSRDEKRTPGGDSFKLVPSAQFWSSRHDSLVSGREFSEWSTTRDAGDHDRPRSNHALSKRLLDYPIDVPATKNSWIGSSRLAQMILDNRSVRPGMQRLPLLSAPHWQFLGWSSFHPSGQPLRLEKFRGPDDLHFKLKASSDWRSRSLPRTVTATHGTRARGPGIQGPIGPEYVSEANLASDQARSPSHCHGASGSGPMVTPSHRTGRNHGQWYGVSSSWKSHWWWPGWHLALTFPVRIVDWESQSVLRLTRKLEGCTFWWFFFALHRLSRTRKFTQVRKNSESCESSGLWFSCYSVYTCSS